MTLKVMDEDVSSDDFVNFKIDFRYKLGWNGND